MVTLYVILLTSKPALITEIYLTSLIGLFKKQFSVWKTVQPTFFHFHFFHLDWKVYKRPGEAKVSASASDSDFHTHPCLFIIHHYLIVIIITSILFSIQYNQSFHLIKPAKRAPNIDDVVSCVGELLTTYDSHFLSCWSVSSGANCLQVRGKRVNYL